MSQVGTLGNRMCSWETKVFGEWDNGKLGEWDCFYARLRYGRLFWEERDIGWGDIEKRDMLGKGKDVVK